MTNVCVCVCRISSMGVGNFTEQTPPHVSSMTFPSSCLCENGNHPREAWGQLHLASLQRWPRAAVAASLGPSPLSLMLGFPHFPPGKDQLLKHRMECQQITDSALTEQLRPALREGRVILLSVSPLPSARVRTC